MATTRHVHPSDRGGWDVRTDGSGRVGAHEETKRDAIRRAREIVARRGGGEVVVHGPDGTVEERTAVDGARPRKTTPAPRPGTPSAAPPRADGPNPPVVLASPLEAAPHDGWAADDSAVMRRRAEIAIVAPALALAAVAAVVVLSRRRRRSRRRLPARRR